MQKMLRTLAYIDLVLGTIGSIVLAKDLGKTADIFLSSIYYERDWTLTICIFFAGLFGVLESVLKSPYCRIIHPKMVNIRKKIAKFRLYFKPFRHSRHPFLVERNNNLGFLNTL